jgi:hypothetical protein
MFANSKFAAAVVTGAMLLSFGSVANALPLSYSTSGSPTQLKLGDTIGSPYDILTIAGASGTITTDPSTILLNTLYFTAGVNATVPATYNNQFSFAETVTLGSGTGTLVVPFNLSISYSDTLTVVGGTTLSILVGANLWNIVVNGLTIGPNPGGTMTGLLTAQVSDPPSATPLPAALVLFGSGLGAMGLFSRRRKRKASAVPAI